MSINIDYELKKLNFEYKISKELNKNYILAILKYCNAIEYFEEDKKKYEYIRKDIFDRFVILEEYNTSTTKDLSSFNIKENKFILFINYDESLECNISLYEEGNLSGGKLSTRYLFTFSPEDVGYESDAYILKCIHRFINNFNINTELFDNLNLQVRILNSKDKKYAYMYEEISVSDFKKAFNI